MDVYLFPSGQRVSFCSFSFLCRFGVKCVGCAGYILYLLIMRNGFVVQICPVFLPCDQMLPSAGGSTSL